MRDAVVLFNAGHGDRHGGISDRVGNASHVAHFTDMARVFVAQGGSEEIRAAIIAASEGEAGFKPRLCSILHRYCNLGRRVMSQLNSPGVTLGHRIDNDLKVLH